MQAEKQDDIDMGPLIWKYTVLSPYYELLLEMDLGRDLYLLELKQKQFFLYFLYKYREFHFKIFNLSIEK